MISNINDKPVEGALCLNCRTLLESFVIDTNKGKQAVYQCTSENCPRRYNLNTGYFPPAETGVPAAKNT